MIFYMELMLLKKIISFNVNEIQLYNNLLDFYFIKQRYTFYYYFSKFSLRNHFVYQYITIVNNSYHYY